MYASIQIYLQKDSQKDDILKIVPKDDDSYSVEFVQNTINNVVYTTLNMEDLPEYLKNFLYAVSVDEEGARLVQFDIPAFPTVIIKAKNVMSYVFTLLNQIRTIEAEWPTEQTVSSMEREKKKQQPHTWATARHSIYEDDEETLDA